MKGNKMSIFKPVNEKDAKGKVKKVFEDIKNTRNIKQTTTNVKYINFAILVICWLLWLYIFWWRLRGRRRIDRTLE